MALAVAAGAVLAAAGLRPAAASTKANWLNATSGNWTDPANWSTSPDYPNNGSPAGATYDVNIDATGSAYTVSLDSNVALDNLSIESADATLSLTGSGRIAFEGTSAIDGNGQIVFNGNGAASLTSTGGSGESITIGSGISIRTGSGGGTVGSAAAPLVNDGTIACQTPLTGLTITGENWTNNGTLDLSAGTLNLDGTFTSASLGTFSRTGGTLLIDGTMDNTGNVFDLARTGAFDLNGGTIKGGTIQSTDGSQFVYSNGGTLDGMTIDYDMLLTGISDSLKIQNGLTINNRTITAHAGAMSFSGAQTLGGTGTINITGLASSDETTDIGGDNLTIGSGITLQTATPQANATGGLHLDGHWVNKGTIIGQVPQLSVEFTGDHWSNQGTIRLSAGALRLGGTFKPEALGNFVRTGGTVVLEGTVDNSGDTLALDASTGSWLMDEAHINGGTVTSADGAMLINENQALLDWVILGAPILNKAQSWLELGGDTTLDDATITLDGSGTFPGLVNTNLQFTSTNPQMLGGTGEVVFDAGIEDGYSGVIGDSSPHIVTFAPGITFRTGTGSGFFYGDFINQGMIWAQTGGKNIAITGGTFTNDGTIQASNGGRVTVMAAADLTNLANNTLTGGTWAAYAGSTLDFSGRTFTTNAAHILLDGAGSTFAAVNPLASNVGTFEIDHGRNFSTVGSLDNSGVLRIGQNSILTVNGTLTNSGRINGKGRIVADVNSSGIIAPGDSPGLLTITGNLTQSPDATIEIEVGGTTPGVDYDVLDVSGMATLGGSLDITLLNGFVPTPEETFDFFDLGSKTGEFSNVILPDLPPGVNWDIHSLESGGPTGVPELAGLGLVTVIGLTLLQRRGGAFGSAGKV